MRRTLELLLVILFAGLFLLSAIGCFVPQPRHGGWGGPPPSQRREDVRHKHHHNDHRHRDQYDATKANPGNIRVKPLPGEKNYRK